jgi:hypothetical protein
MPQAAVQARPARGVGRSRRSPHMAAPVRTTGGQSRIMVNNWLTWGYVWDYYDKTLINSIVYMVSQALTGRLWKTVIELIYLRMRHGARLMSPINRLTNPNQNLV